jgi:hypothetical protein
MNSRPTSVLILAAALSASTFSPIFALPQNDAPIAYSVRTVIATSNGNMKVERGMTREDVSFAMRYKTREQLSSNVWVYTGFHAENSDLANDKGCGTVVITFSNDRVADLQLLNKPAVSATAENLSLGSPARNIASK